MTYATQIYDDVWAELPHLLSKNPKNIGAISKVALVGVSEKNEFANNLIQNLEVMELPYEIFNLPSATGRSDAAELQVKKIGGKSVLRTGELLERRSEFSHVVSCPRGNIHRRWVKLILQSHKIEFYEIESFLIKCAIPQEDERHKSWRTAIKNSIGEYLNLKNILYDEYSKVTLGNVLAFHLTGDLSYIRRVYRPYQTLYFDTDIPINFNSRDIVFVDCGASIGESLFGFLDLSNQNYKKIILLEPDLLNIRLLKRSIYNLRKCGADVSKIQILQKGVAEKAGFAAFNHVGGHGGTFNIGDCKDEPVELISIDSLGLSGEIIIKADVEGFEERLIQGAKETIVKSKPKILISAYHKPSHILDICGYLLSLNKEYRVALRHHTHLRWDTCLYFF